MSARQPPWSAAWIRQHPLRFLGIVLHLVLRTLFAIFWLAAGVNKIVTGWLHTDLVERYFNYRLTELHPDSFAVWYLETLAIPLYLPIAWVVTLGELYSAVGLLLGWTTRRSAFVAFFLLFNFALGGYYDASLIPFFLLVFLFMAYPSGEWLGMDRSRKHRAARAA
ncbi:MAG: DoxX family membrane protein [Pseudomonadota bacterium]